MEKNPLFYGKVLLFGEYGIIGNSMGLSIPHTYYKGAFQFASEQVAVQEKSNFNLCKYVAYLKSEDAPCDFDFNRFDAAKISFILSIPALLGASLLTLKDSFVKEEITNLNIILGIIFFVVLITSMDSMRTEWYLQ